MSKHTDPSLALLYISFLTFDEERGVISRFTVMYIPSRFNVSNIVCLCTLGVINSSRSGRDKK